MKMMRGLSIRWVLLVMVAGPTLAVAAAVFWFGDRAAREAGEELAQRAMTAASERTKAKLDALLSEAERLRVWTEVGVARGGLPTDDVDGWGEPLWPVLRSFPDIASVAWASDAGHTVWLARDGEALEYVAQVPGAARRDYAVPATGVSDMALSDRSDFDSRTRPWYRAAVEAEGAAAWTEVYAWVGSDGTDATQISVATVRRVATEPAGVVSVDVTLSALSAELSALPLAETGIIEVSDETGRVVATSKGGVIGPGGERRVADASLTAAGVTGFDGSAVAAGVLQRVTYHGQGARLITDRYARDGGLAWDIRVVVPEAEFLGPVWRARQRAAGLALVAALVTLAIALVAARGVAVRLGDVMGHVRRVGDGEFDSRIEEADPREWRELTQTLNGMAGELHDFFNTRRALGVAMEVQHSLLPEKMPEVAGLDVFGRSQYCDETGGDYYDFITPDGQGEGEGGGKERFMIALGDVTGHGVAAALLMATGRAALKASIAIESDLGAIMQGVNVLLAKDARHRRFMTMMLASIDLETRRVSWASAGHDPMMLYHPETDAFAEPDGASLPLGVLLEEEYETYTHGVVEPGTVLFIGTDGVWESANEDQKLFGKDRLRETIRQHAHKTAQEIGLAIEAAAEAFRGEAPQGDDVTYVVVKFA
ncbi:MAG: SpoIIE family protein phosphatase [Planctomycetota bacterium]